jgi:hypothetical protein
MRRRLAPALLLTAVLLLAARSPPAVIAAGKLPAGFPLPSRHSPLPFSGIWRPSAVRFARVTVIAGLVGLRPDGGGGGCARRWKQRNAAFNHNRCFDFVSLFAPRSGADSLSS